MAPAFDFLPMQREPILDVNRMLWPELLHFVPEYRAQQVFLQHVRDAAVPSGRAGNTILPHANG